MAIAVVGNRANAGGGGGAPQGLLSAAATSADLIVCWLWIQDTLASVTDPAGYTRRSSKQHSTGANTSLLVVQAIAVGGETTVNFTYGGTANWETEVAHFSGAAGAGTVFDAAATAKEAAAATSLQATSLTPAASGELMIVGNGIKTAGYGATHAIDSSYVNLFDGVWFTHLIPGYKIKTDALAEAPTVTWTLANDVVDVHLAFAPFVASATAPDRHLPRGVPRGLNRGVA